MLDRISNKISELMHGKANQANVDPFAEQTEAVATPIATPVATPIATQVAELRKRISQWHTASNRVRKNYAIERLSADKSTTVVNKHHQHMYKTPHRYFDHVLSHDIMNFPVELDELTHYVMDFSELDIYWSMCGGRFLYINPVTQQPIKKITFLSELKHEIDAHIMALEAMYIEPQITVLQQQIKRFLTEKSAMDRLAVQNIAFEQIPKEFIRENIVSEIIDVPVLINNKYVVDYTELVKWWDQDPQHKYMDYYSTPHLPIESISFMPGLKKRIDAFVNNPAGYLLEKRMLDSGILPSTLYLRQCGIFSMPTPLLSKSDKADEIKARISL